MCRLLTDSDREATDDNQRAGGKFSFGSFRVS